MDFNTAVNAEAALGRAIKAANSLDSSLCGKLLTVEQLVQEVRLCIGNVETGTDLNDAASRLLSHVFGTQVKVTGTSIGYSDLLDIQHRKARCAIS